MGNNLSRTEFKIKGWKIIDDNEDTPKRIIYKNKHGQYLYVRINKSCFGSYHIEVRKEQMKESRTVNSIWDVTPFLNKYRIKNG